MAWQDREKEWATLRATEQALGELCMVWAALDRLLDYLLSEILRIEDQQTAIITSTIREVPPRCTMIERLLLTVDIDDEWKAWLTGIMVLIRDDLGPKRNRYVHDRWMVGLETMTKVNRQVRTPKPQSHQKPEIQFDVEETVAVETLKEWCEVGHAIGLAFSDAIQDLRLWNLSLRAPTAHKQLNARRLAALRL